MMAYVWLWLLVASVYLLVTADVSAANVVLAAVLSSGLVCVLPMEKGFVVRGRRLWWALPAYVVLVAWDVLVNGLLVAWMVLGPGGRVRPGVVMMPAVLKSDTGRALRAHAITLSPGQMVMGFEGDMLRVHCLDVEAAESATPGGINAQVRMLTAMID